MIERILFPRRCPICDDLTAGDRKICGRCVGIPRLVPEPRCMKCGKNIDDSNEEFCRDCNKDRHFYTRGIALYEYDSVKDSLNNFKNSSRPEYADYYAENIVKYLGETIKDFEADALIPIPLHITKYKKRGYNQSEILANEISKRTGIPVMNDCLKRVKKTKEQKKLNDRERQKNLVGAFHMSEKGVKLEKVILVDDVYTTGATLDEAAKALLTGGITKIYFLTVAIGTDV